MGGPAAEGQLSILPQYNTPGTRFGDSDVTPAIIPFAFMLGGACEGGYATGFPAADKVVAVDMHGHDCSATALDAALVDQYTVAVAAAKTSSAQAAAAATAKSKLAAAVGDATDTQASAGSAATPAAEGSDVDKVGQVILATVAGRTADAALADGNEPDNPFGLDADPLLLAAGVYFLNNDSSGKAIDTSEFSIYADYLTPRRLFKPAP